MGSKEEEMEPCWYNRYSLKGIPCPKEGKWKIAADVARFPIIRWFRWCDDHKHEDDVLVTKG